MTQAHSGTVAGFIGIVTTLPTFQYHHQHGLTVPITFYGTTYSSIDVMEFGLTDRSGDDGPVRLINSSFKIHVGETIVVGTSKLNGGGKALVALLTVVP